ncbi:response regulator transcription factor [Rugamonas sp.]|uniref:response regulator transcription factor n=1 Tax=Rugamonas sp. TaxID=1926287 RepID=UPI0025EC9B70|nr:response regulator transcription factor [Rugamonas sp.]
MRLDDLHHHQHQNKAGDVAPDRPISVLAVDDHPMFLAGIASVLAAEPGVELIGQASSGADAVLRHRELRPDITLMDIQMRGMCGIDATEAIVREFPQARIIVLSAFEGDGFVLRALSAGAFGYLLKSGLRRELMTTLRSVHAGRRNAVSAIVANVGHYAQGDRLTARELDVLRLVAVGNSNRRVGERLAISEETVKAYMKNILPKLGAQDRAHAVALAIGRGILPVSCAK